MPAPPHTRLDSWKAIADYLDRDVTTAMRWARDCGLPVYRVPRPGGKRHAVFAYTHELDAWLSGQQAAQSPHAESITAPVPALTTESASPARKGRARYLVVAALAFVAVTCLVALWALRSQGQAEVGGVTFSGQQLLAWNNGKVVWSYDFGQPLLSLRPGEFARRVQILDLNGDGQKEVLVGPPLLDIERGDASTDALYCFSSRGKLLWRHAFDDRVRFGGEDCGPRWGLRTLMMTGDGPHRSLWCTICSFPTSVSMVVKIDPSGHAAKYFVNYGHLGPLNEVQASGVSYLLAGGINNEYSDGALTVLKETEASGHSPQTGALSDCDACPQGQPYRYFLFPRSEVGRVVGPPYNALFEILVTNGQVQAMTSEGTNAPSDGVWALYDISGAFVPRSVFFSDHYRLMHQRLSAEGKIKHSLDACLERLRPIVVREWSPEAGWKNLPLPPMTPKGAN